MASDVDSLNAAFIAARDKAVADGTASKTTATASQNQLNSDINFFLTMLTTQLKNQDPTSPMDTAQFTQQIAQYSGVQQQVTTNANLEKLLAQGKASDLTTAVGYIGKEIETDGNTGLVIGGQGAFSYSLPKAAANASITIKSADGRVVFTGKGNTQVGRNIVLWDGVNSGTGKQEPDGTYTISVTATDTSNVAITPTTHAVTIVSGVETDGDGKTMLTDSDGHKVEMSTVQAIRSPTRADLSNTANNDTTSGGNT